MNLMGVVMLAMPISIVSLLLLGLAVFGESWMRKSERYACIGLGGAFLVVFGVLFALG